MEHVLADNVIVKPGGKVLTVEQWTNKCISVCRVVQNTERMTWKVDRAYVNGIGQDQIALKVSFFFRSSAIVCTENYLNSICRGLITH